MGTDSSLGAACICVVSVGDDDEMKWGLPCSRLLLEGSL